MMEILLIKKEWRWGIMHRIKKIVMASMGGPTNDELFTGEYFRKTNFTVNIILHVILL